MRSASFFTRMATTADRCSVTDVSYAVTIDQPWEITYLACPLRSGPP
jgi:hypothetical protein